MIMYLLSLTAQVQLAGYIQNAPEEHSYKGVLLLRTLLCASPELVVGKGQSVMCHFFFSDWNYQVSELPPTIMLLLLS